MPNLLCALGNHGNECAPRHDRAAFDQSQIHSLKRQNALLQRMLNELAQREAATEAKLDALTHAANHAPSPPVGNSRARCSTGIASWALRHRNSVH
jgi:hypothetical protein